MAAFGGMAAGSWFWGIVATREGIPVALDAAAAVLLGCALLGRWLRLPAPEDLNLDPLRQWEPPETAVGIEQRSGPVVISIEYIIAEEDIPEFLAAMSDRRRIRRRDGARHWALMRDLADPRLWIESFSTPTWLDYIRHNNRITHADAGIAHRVRMLHRGVAPPRVRRMIERQTGSLPAGRAPGPRELAEPLTDPTRSS
jgi:hypothetical protein